MGNTLACIHPNDALRCVWISPELKSSFPPMYGLPLPITPLDCPGWFLDVWSKIRHGSNQFRLTPHFNTERIRRIPVPDCACFNSGLLPFERKIAQITNVQSIRIHLRYTRSSWISTGVNLVVVFLQSGVCIFPSSEVPHFSFDLLPH